MPSNADGGTNFIGHSRNHAGHLSTRRTGALDKPRCALCGKPNPTPAHVEKCDEDAIKLSLIDRKKPHRGRMSISPERAEQMS